MAPFHIYILSEQTGYKWCLYSLKKMGETGTRPNLTPSIKFPLRSYQYRAAHKCFVCSFEQIQMTKYPLNMTSCGVGSHIVYSYDIFSPPSVCFETCAYIVVPFVLLILGCLILRCCSGDVLLLLLYFLCFKYIST